MPTEMMFKNPRNRFSPRGKGRNAAWNEVKKIRHSGSRGRSARQQPRPPAPRPPRPRRPRLSRGCSSSRRPRGSRREGVEEEEGEEEEGEEEEERRRRQPGRSCLSATRPRSSRRGRRRRRRWRGSQWKGRGGGGEKIEPVCCLKAKSVREIFLFPIPLFFSCTSFSPLNIHLSPSFKIKSDHLLFFIFKKSSCFQSLYFLAVPPPL